MWCTVYPLFAGGKRLSIEAAKAGGRHGWLFMFSAEPKTGMPLRQAHLLEGPEGEINYSMGLIPGLYSCELRCIKEGSIRLTGKDPHSAIEVGIRQSWWCVPDGMEVVAA